MMEPFSSSDRPDSSNDSVFYYDIDQTIWMGTSSSSLEAEYHSYYGYDEPEELPSAHPERYNNQLVLPHPAEDLAYGPVEDHQYMPHCHFQSASPDVGILLPMPQIQGAVCPQHKSYNPVKRELYIDTLTLGTSPIGSPFSEDALTTGTLSSPTPLLQSQKTFEIVQQEFANFFTDLKLKHQDLVFMPQKIYQSHAKADLERYVKDANLQSPILFRSKIDGRGIPLRDVLSCSKLKDLELLKLAHPTDLVLDHGPPSTSIRLQVPGYKIKKEQKRQISLRTYEKEKKPLNRVRLLSAVTRAIKQILENLAQKTQDANEVAYLYPKWTIGDGANRIGIDDLCIFSLHNVSQGTWQPHLYLDPKSPLSGHGRH